MMEVNTGANNQNLIFFFKCMLPDVFLINCASNAALFILFLHFFFLENSILIEDHVLFPLSRRLFFFQVQAELVKL